MSRIGEAHWDHQAPPSLLRRLHWRRFVSWWFDRRTLRVVALVHFRRADGVIATQEISAWFLDIEIHDGELVLINAHDEEFRVPLENLLTLEIR